MTGKALAMLLRHDPARFGVALDCAGWGDVAAVAAGLGLDVVGLLTIIRQDEKGRFVLSEDGAHVRAAQGHSFEVDLGLVPREPPSMLWHGTHSAVLEPIRREGLRPMGRTHVHLSGDPETASRVGGRRGKPVLLRVMAGAMWAAGTPFYRAENGVWLVDAVTPGFLEVP